jgi:hypothetical protein
MGDQVQQLGHFGLKGMGVFGHGKQDSLKRERV